MSRVTNCPRCGKNVVEPAYEGDGAYPVSPMCRCPENQPNLARHPRVPLSEVGRSAVWSRTSRSLDRLVSTQPEVMGS